MTLNRILFLTNFLILSLNAASQKKDYKVFRNNNDIQKLSCKPFDSLIILETTIKLEKLDTSLFDRNIYLYYRDLGWSYYRLYLFQKDTQLIQKSISCYKNVIRYQSKHSATLWDLTFCYYLLGDCLNGKYYLAKYKKATPKKYQSPEQIKLMTRKCDG